MKDYFEEFRSHPGKEPCMDALCDADHKKEAELYPNARDGFYCYYGNVGTWAPTFEEAVQELIMEMMVIAAKGYRREEICSFLLDNERSLDGLGKDPGSVIVDTANSKEEEEEEDPGNQPDPPFDNLRYIAEANHEVIRILQNSFVWKYTPHWEELSELLQLRSRNYTNIFLSEKTPEKFHEKWCEIMTSNGFVYGPKHNEELKQHPFLVPYEKLSKRAQIGIQVSSQIVSIMSEAVKAMRS